MPATIPPAARALLALLLPIAALFVLEGWSVCVMLEEAAKTDATTELYRELELYLALSLLRTDESELSESVQMTMQQRTRQINQRKLQIRQRNRC